MSENEATSSKPSIPILKSSSLPISSTSTQGTTVVTLSSASTMDPSNKQSSSRSQSQSQVATLSSSSSTSSATILSSSSLASRQIVIEMPKPQQQQQQQNSLNKPYSVVVTSSSNNPQQQSQSSLTLGAQMGKGTAAQNPHLMSALTLKSPTPQQQQQQQLAPTPLPVQVQTPTIGTGVSSPSGGHRTRKEKLICRSVTDSSLPASLSMTPVIIPPQSGSSSSTNSPRASSSSSSSLSSTGSFHPESGSPPRKSGKKSTAIPGTPRPYRKKQGAVPVKSIIDPLNREAYDHSMSSKANMNSGSGSPLSPGQSVGGSSSNSGKVTQGDKKFVGSPLPSNMNQSDKPAKRPYRKRNALGDPTSKSASPQSATDPSKPKRKYNKTKNKDNKGLGQQQSGQQPPDSPDTAMRKKLGRPKKGNSPSTSSTLTQQEINQQQLLLQQQQKQQQKQQQIDDGKDSSSSSTTVKYRDPYEMLRLHLKDKKAPDLRVFGSPNVLPIFKPGQRPSELLNSLMTGADKEREAARRQAKELLQDNNHASVDGRSSVKTQNVHPHTATSATSSSSSSHNTAGNSGTTTTTTPALKELEVVAIPVDLVGDKLCFSSNGEDRVLFEYLLNRKGNQNTTVLPNQPTITNSTNVITLGNDELKDKDSTNNTPSATIVTNLHLSSLDAPPPSRKQQQQLVGVDGSLSFAPPPLPPPPSPTPLSSTPSQSIDFKPLQFSSSSSVPSQLNSGSNNGSLQQQQSLTSVLPESSHFMPIQTGYQSQSLSSIKPIPLGGSCSGSGAGRESPATATTTTCSTTASSGSGSFLPPSRFQAPSPSPSSVSGGSNSGRRYSRRRHSRLYPAFEQEHCLYSGHTCTLPVAYGSTYCIKHLPQRYSPYYVRCAFFSGQTRRRCPNLQYSHDGKRKFCDMHASRLALHRQKICRKPRPAKTFKDDASEIKRIIEQTKRPPRSEAVTYLEDLCDYKLQTQCMEYQMEEKGPTDVDGTVESLGQFQAEYDSDGGVETGEKYECLKNAGFYTTEEVVRILQSKLCRLRQLYIKEFDYIKFYYLMKRREYLLAEERLKYNGVNSQGSSTHTVYTSNPKDLVACKGATVEQYSQDSLASKKMKALLNYKELRGDKALLHHIARQRYEEIKEKEGAESRSKPSGEDAETESESEDEKRSSVIDDLLNQAKSLSRSQSQNKKVKDRLCAFHEGTDKCREKIMPGLKYCLAHVLQDEKQCLFDRCTYVLDTNETCPAIIFKRIDKGRCSLHRRIYIKDLPESGKEDDKARLKMKSTGGNASIEETQAMFEDLIAKEVPNVDEFDAIIQDILAKGLDCSDTEYSYSGSDDDDAVGRREYRKTPEVVAKPEPKKKSSSNKQRQPAATSSTGSKKAEKGKASATSSRQKKKKTSESTSLMSKKSTKNTPPKVKSRKKVSISDKTKLVKRKISSSASSSSRSKTQGSRTKEKVNRAKAQVNRKKSSSGGGGQRRRSRKSAQAEDDDVQVEAIIQRDEEDDDDDADDPDADVNDEDEEEEEEDE